MKSLLLALATSAAVLAADVTNAVPHRTQAKRDTGTGAGNGLQTTGSEGTGLGNSLQGNGAEGTGAGNGRVQTVSEHQDPNAMPARKVKNRKAGNSRARYNVRDSKSKASRNTNHPNWQLNPASSAPKAVPAPAPAPAPVPGTDVKP